MLARHQVVALGTWIQPQVGDLRADARGQPPLLMLPEHHCRC